MNLSRRRSFVSVLVAAVLACVLALTLQPATARAASTPSVAYRTNLTTTAWLPWKKNGFSAGSVKRAAQIEALEVRLSKSALKKGAIRYRVHIAGRGWQGWRSSGRRAGFIERDRVVDAVKIKLTGILALKYDVIYRVRVGGTGWLGWAKNGDIAGVSGGSAHVGAIKIKLVPKGTVVAAKEPVLDLSKTQTIKLTHYMQRSMSQLDYAKNFQHGGCCAMSYAIGISILTKQDVNPMTYYRGGLCYYDDGHVGTYRTGFEAAAVYENLRDGKPVMVHYIYSTGQHWVLVLGVRGGIDTQDLTYADFIAIDPYSGKECALTACSYFSRAHTVAIMPMV